MGPEDDLNIGRALSQKWSRTTPPSDDGLAALIGAVRDFNQFVRYVDPETLDPEFYTQARILLVDARAFADELERDGKAFPYKLVPLGWWTWRGRVITDVLEKASRELGIASSLKVHLFRGALPGEFPDFVDPTPTNGICFNNCQDIACNVDLDSAGLVRTTAHELAHVAGRDEVDAQHFAAQFAAKFGSETISSRQRVHVTIGGGPHIVVKTGGSR